MWFALHKLSQTPPHVRLCSRVGLCRLEILADGDGARIIEREKDIRMPLLMWLGYWLCEIGAISLRARLD